MLTLRWDDVSLTRAEWLIPDTKAGRPHLLPVPHGLVDTLQSLPRVDGNPYVFPGQNGTGHLQNMKRAWDRIRLAAGIQDVRFHDLRRTVGSWLAGSGESLHLIGKVLNHRNVSTTAIYARLNLNPVRLALERNATKMLAAAAPQRTPVVMRTERKRVRSLRHPSFHNVEPTRNESGCEIIKVTASCKSLIGLPSGGGSLFGQYVLSQCWRTNQSVSLGYLKGNPLANWAPLDLDKMVVGTHHLSQAIQHRPISYGPLLAIVPFFYASTRTLVCRTQ